MNDTPKCAVICGGFDDLRCADVRLLQEAAHAGPLHVLLWTDALVRSVTGCEPRFPDQERLYCLQAIRFVHHVHLIAGPAKRDALPAVAGVHPQTWVVREAEDCSAKRAFCAEQGLQYRIVADRDLAGFPEDTSSVPRRSSRKKVLVTGCFDWFHSGHVRFFEEVSELGDLYVVIGHDANIRLLKGEGHPMFPQEQRQYMVGSVRYVTQALISSGHGWLDAEPEIERLRPDIYAVNEDGDKPEKRRYCESHGIEYVVLRRLPKPGLPKRQSTILRGF